MKGCISYSIRKNCADLYLVNDTDENKDRFGDDWSHYKTLDALLKFMKSRGFKVGRDPEVEKCYKSISKDHWYGRKGDLEFTAHRYSRGFEIEFFQNLIFENKAGGKYDFDKFKRMPYLLKLTFLNETRHMGKFLGSLGIVDDSKPEYKTAEDKIKQDFVDCWHHPQKDMNFSLSDLDGTTCEYSYNNTDRDKKIIYNGQIKYFRHWNGRLMRGKVYHNINNMWWIILNDREYTNEADFYLFDPSEEDLKSRRLKKGKLPKEFVEKKEKIEQSSTKELLRELKRRGVKVAV